MGLLSSEKVSVFPSAYRGDYSSGKFTSEKNLTSVLRSLSSSSTNLDRGGFIVNYANGILTLVISGYYFEANIGNTLRPNMYAYINISGGYLFNVSSDNKNLDVGNNFTGLYIGEGDSDRPTYFTNKLKITDDQGKLINTGYIDQLIDANGNWIDYGSISAGDSTTPVYFDNGEPKAIDGTIGDGGKTIIYLKNGKLTQSNSSIGTRFNTNYSQSVFLNSGVITEGPKITYSTTAPGTAAGSNGDIWFVYK